MQSEVGYKAFLCFFNTAAHSNFSLSNLPLPSVACLSLFLSQQIRKLRRELESSQEKVATLTSQLSANVSTQADLAPVKPGSAGKVV